MNLKTKNDIQKETTTLLLLMAKYDTCNYFVKST